MRSRSRSRAASASVLALLLVASTAVAGESPAPSPLALPHATTFEIATARIGDGPFTTSGVSPTFAQAPETAGAPAPAPSSENQKLPGKRTALLYSLLLPGAGELSLGAKGRAIGFFVVEGLIWTHYVYYQVAGGMRRDDYVEQAQLNAGVGVSSASDDYWRLVGQYSTSSGTGPDAYEDVVRREARDIYPNDPAAQDAYVAENLPSGDEAWAWSSPELQKAYKDTRAASKSAYDRAKYSFAAAILNRLVSAVDTQILHRRLSKDGQARLDEGTRLMADATPDGGTRLILLRRF